MDTGAGIDDEKQKGRTKTKWGPVLVEPRHSRFSREGRTIMEKAQDRKKKVNLKSTKGTNKTISSFSVLSDSEILEVAECVDVRLGKDQVEVNEAILTILDKEKEIAVDFDKYCQMCQDLSLDKEIKSDMITGLEDVAPCTPVD
jgi:hypothetical protein